MLIRYIIIDKYNKIEIRRLKFLIIIFEIIDRNKYKR